MMTRISASQNGCRCARNGSSDRALTMASTKARAVSWTLSWRRRGKAATRAATTWGNRVIRTAGLFTSRSYGLGPQQRIGRADERPDPHGDGDAAAARYCPPA